MSIDVWDIERTGTVIQSNIAGILQREATGGLLPGEIVQRDAAGFISRIFVPFINSGSIRANGVDFGLQYVYPTSFGTFTSLTQATFLNSYKFKLGVDQNGAVGRCCHRRHSNAASNDGFIRWRGIQRLDWNWNGFDIIGTARFLDGFHELNC